MGKEYQQRPGSDQRRSRRADISHHDHASGAEPPIASAVSLSAIMRLQRTIGNQAVQRLLGHGRLTNGGSRLQTKRTGAYPAVGAISLHSAKLGIIQRYGAREHTRFGEVGSMITPVENKYIVKQGLPTYHIVDTGETASKIAAKYGVSQDLLIARNAATYRVVDTKEGPKPVGFTKGDTLVVPGQTAAEVAAANSVTEADILNANAKSVQTWTMPITQTEFKGFDRGRTVIVTSGQVEVTHGAWASKAKGQRTITIKGIDFTYGEVIALGGDLYEKPEDLYNAPKQELQDLKDLLVKEAKNPKSVGDADWERATKGRRAGQRYLELASRNTSHYGLHDPALTPVKSKSGVDHKSEWEKDHRLALETAQKGDKERALGINAFADHYLTDAFSSGHLFHKEDVMERFEQVFDAKAQEAFFHQVAYSAWSQVGDKLDKYETFATKAGKHWNISFPEYFQQLLQGIYDDKADGKPLVLNMVVLMIHDELNSRGVEAENQKGDKWELSGDGKLNERSLSIGRQAVAQSQVNILNNVGNTGTLDFPALFKSVWDFVPRPSQSGTKVINQLINQFANPSDPKTLKKAREIVVSRIDMIIDGLVDRKKLKKA